MIPIFLTVLCGLCSLVAVGAFLMMENRFNLAYVWATLAPAVLAVFFALLLVAHDLVRAAL